jgi:transcription elongation GreA/GreB family factor
MEKTILCTERGYRKLQEKKKKLEKELAEIKQSSVPLARADPGNLWHDNAPFEEAERNIHQLTSLLEDVTERLDAAEIVDPDKRPKDKVGIGSKVEVDINGRKCTYLVVGWGEGNPKKREVSYASPMGSALMDAKVRDRRKVSTPEEDLVVKVLQISYSIGVGYWVIPSARLRDGESHRRRR